MPMRIARPVLAFSCCLLFLAACEQGVKQEVRDPIHQRVFDYLAHIDKGEIDAAYAMWDEPTREAWPKDEFTKFVNEKQKKLAKWYLVTNVTRNPAANSATVTTQLTGQFKNWNSFEDAKFMPTLVEKGGAWYFTDENKVATLEERKRIDEERLKRVAQYAHNLTITDLKVESVVIDNEGKLVFMGNIQNKGDTALEMVRMEFRFLGPDNETLLRLHVFPVFLNPVDDTKKPLLPGKTNAFKETIATEVPTRWTGEYKWEIWDAGSQADLLSTKATRK